MMGKTESNDIFLAKGGYLIQNFHTPSDEQYASLLEGYKGIAKLTEGTDITLNAMIVPTAVNNSALLQNRPSLDKWCGLTRLPDL